MTFDWMLDLQMLCVAVPQVLSELLPPIVSGDSLWSACSLVWLFLSGTFLRHPLHCICKTRKVYFRGGRSVCRRVTRKSKAIKNTLRRGVMDLKTLLFIHKGLYQMLLTKPLWLCPETRSLAKIAESGPGWPKNGQKWMSLGGPKTKSPKFFILDFLISVHLLINCSP